ncbi:MAG TPA: AtpZ/AtpI family protein [Acidimicrobiales bacterium]|nr:AtpZ/AtpI family protein [Acidimicrobiales bacterium]
MGRTPGLADLLTLGLYNGVCVALGAGAGLAVDAWLNTTPLFVLIGLALGVAAGAVGTWNRMKQFLHD